jgi:UDP-glucose 4-epimerase
MQETPKRAVVTGGAGFIGSHVVDALIEKGFDVAIIDSLVAGKKERVHPRAELHELDIRDFDAIAPLFQEGDYVFHLAALPSVPYSIAHPEETNEINIGGALSVIKAARRAGVKRIIYSASSAVYGNNEASPLTEDLLPEPVNPYGIQKYAVEHYLRAASILHGIETVSLRYFNVYGLRMNMEGPYAAVIGAFVRQRKQQLPLRINGDGEQTRDFVHVEDVARANILAATSPLVGAGESINIGTNKSISINELAKIIGGDIEYGQVVTEVRHSLADNQKAKKLLEWEPRVNFEEGMDAVLREWGLIPSLNNS